MRMAIDNRPMLPVLDCSVLLLYFGYLAYNDGQYLFVIIMRRRIGGQKRTSSVAGLQPAIFREMV